MAGTGRGMPTGWTGAASRSPGGRGRWRAKRTLIICVAMFTVRMCGRAEEARVGRKTLLPRLPCFPSPSSAPWQYVPRSNQLCIRGLLCSVIYRLHVEAAANIHAADISTLQAVVPTGPTDRSLGHSVTMPAHTIYSFNPRPFPIRPLVRPQTGGVSVTPFPPPHC